MNNSVAGPQPGTASARINRVALDNELNQFKQNYPGILQDAHNTMFSDVALLIAPAQLAQMQAVIAAVERVVALPGWQQEIFKGEAQYVPRNQGVFFGYDFHLNEQGAHLIEINTNAGGGFLSALFEHSQQNANLPGRCLAADNLPEVYVQMFRREWALQRGDAPLQTIAIVDEAPQSQYFYPEFTLAKQMFEQAGLRAYIADPAEFESHADGVYLQGSRIELVYNRLTDFSLAQFPALLKAYQADQVVVTPHPYAYQLYADKRNLVLLTDAQRLSAMGADADAIATLQQGVPQTRLVEKQHEQQWWAERKEWFFKPATGFGGRGSYRGDKLTKRVFDDILQGGYVAQRKAQPGEVMVSVDGAEPAAFKYDVRCYVYQGQIQLLIARMYQGQTTNFRTPGGGFALVRLLE